jgi:hypothetical protein
MTHTNSLNNNIKTNTSVDYEVEVIDISENQIKVRAIDFKGNDSFSRDPKMRKAILGFLQDTWIDKSTAELVLDESHNRQIKLEELGI